VTDGVSLHDDLRDPDDEVRLDAASRAAGSGDLGLVDTLLDLALHDGAEVRATGGPAGPGERVGDRAADALRELLTGVPGEDPRIRAAALDLAEDDARVAALLHRLGDRYEPLRAELESHAEARLRLRAVRALVALLGHPAPGVRLDAAKGLAGVGSSVAGLVAAAVASRVPVEPDPMVWSALVSHDALLTHVPELRDLLARWRRFAPADGSGPTAVLSTALAVPSPSDGRLRPDPAAGLDEEQRAALQRAVLRQAADAIAPTVAGLGVDYGEAAALASLRAFVSDASPATRAGVEAELAAEQGAWFTDPYQPKLAEVWNLLIAALSDDLEYVLRTARLMFAEAARRDAARRAVDAERGPVVAAMRASDLALVLQLLAARLVAAGVDPLPAGPLLRLLPDGEDPLEAMRGALTAAECRASGSLWWLRLQLRPPDRVLYLETLRAAVPATAGGAAELDALAATDDGARVPAAVERLLLSHAERVVLSWLGGLVRWAGLGAELPALRFDAGPVPEVTADDVAADLRRLDWAGRVQVWAHARDRAASWLRDGRRPGDAERVASSLSDKALAGLAQRDPRDPGDAADRLDDLRTAFRRIAEERVETWHLGVAAAAVDGRRWDEHPLDGELGDPDPPLGPAWDLLAGSGEASLVVRLSDGTALALERTRPAPVAPPARPDRAGRVATCPACGVGNRAEGVVAWEYVDDDGHAARDDGYAGMLRATCPACGAGGRFPVRLTLTLHRADGSTTLTWDGPW
jgi:hypothetical protein